MKLSFESFATAVSRGSGKPVVFILCSLLVIAWAIAGPASHYSTAWLLTINTISSIVTLLMVFLIQNGQIRESIAVQSKLNEIIRALEEAENRFIGIEKLSHTELKEIETEFDEVAESVEKQRADKAAPPAEPE